MISKKGCGQNTVHSPRYAIIASLTENRYEKTGILLYAAALPVFRRKKKAFMLPV